MSKRKAKTKTGTEAVPDKDAVVKKASRPGKAAVELVDRRRYVISVQRARYKRLAKLAKRMGRPVAGLGGEFIESGLVKNGMPAAE